MSYRILLVDDEPLARERLKRLLQEHGDFEVVAEAGDGEAAMSWLRQYRCDLVLLDIQMPGKTGLQVAEEIQQLEHVPLVVFCTAYDEHALQAFRVKAIDYLMKPIAKDDLSRALQRAVEWLDQNADETETISGTRTHISARTHNGMQLIPLADIVYFLADQKYVSVHHTGGETLIDESLKHLEDEFSDHFLRVHRSALVSLARIERLEALEESGHEVYLKGLDEGIAVSRRHLPAVRKAMKAL
ncbi:LytTR family DNA-binding domain-containing protein [Bacterioplanoides sp. SCSIO 12839]|uniref:LytR/AlgR family response regulator transcription factor n=1 Tax=Bacterioplanoides sp. SCSIO 12839 TaxID=2829569 RepID=UPI00210593D5|nr:LytTR family DNA-binding domain-containing protein [Bacterioplanoides sp. SCSIO 12839]UTW48353.1 response regulator transcription factor [Bacterioplanoides sp. SCSIO 12839]